MNGRVWFINVAFGIRIPHYPINPHVESTHPLWPSGSIYPIPYSIHCMETWRHGELKTNRQDAIRRGAPWLRSNCMAAMAHDAVGTE